MASEQHYISHFSPQRTNPEALESIFVQRHELLADCVERIRESVLSDNKHHLLFIGPRGAGKTHLVTLIAHRIGQQNDLADKLRLAWLNEDEVSTSFLKLLLRMYRDLSIRYPTEFPVIDQQAIYGKEPEVARDLLGAAMLRHLGSRTLLVIIENLDSLFANMSVGEQRTWRAFVQNHPVFATVGTAQSLFPGVSDRKEPFFGFFDTLHLRPLTAIEATELLEKIASLNHQDDLLGFLKTSTGRARLRAIHHLSGGNPRLYIILSEFLTRESLNNLIRPFEETVDKQLTAYYQERLRWLSAQQQEIVQFLCRRIRPAPVKDIAEGIFAAHNTTTSQLKQLREKGYVSFHPRGREVLYELAEPLMRLSFQVKETHSRQPLALIVDFLRVWYDRKEIEDRITQYDPLAAEREYFEAALAKITSGEPNLRHELLRQDFDSLDLENCDADTLDEMRCLASETGLATDWLKLGVASNFRGDRKTAIEAYSHVITLAAATVDEIARALHNRSVTFARLNRLDDAIADYTQVTALPNVSQWILARALVNRGFLHGRCGREEEEIADYTRVTELAEAPNDQIALALINRAITLEKQAHDDESLADYARVIDLQGAPVEIVSHALFNRGMISARLGKAEEAIADYARVIESPGTSLTWVCKALLNRGVAFGRLGRFAEELADYSHIIQLPNAPEETIARALFNRAITLSQQEQDDEAIADYTRLIKLINAPIEQVAKALLNRGSLFGKVGLEDQQFSDFKQLIELPGAPVAQRAKALLNRGKALGENAHLDEEIADYTTAIELPGLSQTDLAVALLQRGISYGRRGRTSEEIADYTRIIELPEVPVAELAFALNNRGWTLGQTHHAPDALADYNRVINLSHAPANVLAMSIFNRGWTSLALGNSESALADLNRFFSESPKEVIEQLLASYSALLSDTVVAAIFSHIVTSSRCIEHTQNFVSYFSSYRALPQLGEALVRHLSALAKSQRAHSGFDAWIDCWKRASHDHDDMEIPLRLLQVGISYVKTGDEGALLALASEERRIIREALNLPLET
jgi:tetratricopeptide (TPR) repeat protein